MDNKKDKEKHVDTKTYYQIDGLWKFSEEDRYAEGCIVGTGASFHVDMKFKASTLPELLRYVADWIGVALDDVELDACGETGRVDLALLEDEMGNRLHDTPADVEAWKRGEVRAWYCVYTGQVVKITEEIGVCCTPIPEGEKP